MNNFRNGFLTLLLSLTGITHAQAADLHSVQVLDVHYNGEGCPAGSVGTVLSPDTSEFSVLYDAFTMQVGGQTNQTTDAKNCEVQIHLSIPFGYSVSVDSVDFRGFVGLDQGVYAEQNVSQQVGSNRAATYAFGVQLFQGPRQQNYLVRSVRPHFNIPKLIRCLPLRRDTTLYVRTHIKMTGGDQNHAGLMSVDSADGKIEQRYKLSLRSCF